MTTAYSQAIDLLHRVATEKGFLASANDIANYRRVWARDGVICGLAGLVDGDSKLVEVFKQTLITLAEHQHDLGNIPSNVYFTEAKAELSFGGLAGRVDTVSWFIIGVCQYVLKTEDSAFMRMMKPHVLRGFELMHSWEYNDGDLMYVPRSGNWADEYPTQGFILYDQLLRVWAMRSYLKLHADTVLSNKLEAITAKLTKNYKQRGSQEGVYHPKAYAALNEKPYWVASLEPAGYQTQFDAFANSLALMLDLGNDEDKTQLVDYTEATRKSLTTQLLPAFWPVIKEGDDDWRFLINNCKYEFRNYPYEFHNGGTWQMVNGFYAMGLVEQEKKELAEEVLSQIDKLNAKEKWSFYENFNSKTGEPNGVPYCTWSAAGAVLVHQALQGNTLFL
ncbi:glycoside hydrolase 100 family protein [Leeuwenhoekiella polynyae]|uniref:beta-fructofuranosidase n=1 Tax=Leeuwenhoekiella polynyae TaxID=1550906 RepID=A0A4Q0P163_9FLAO|nr:glycoside hydrolase 100 family protein [Leeuwenhoekiella polynyae]RXG18568.1 alkaline and neutral invertase-like protein [Leeuwenhoekiella polynyae]